MSETEYPEANIEGSFDIIDAKAPPVADSAPEDAEEPVEDVWQSAEVGAERPADSGLPKLCLMGEFSAGKSTLSNLLLGEAALPVNVTATQLPPVWMSKGDATPYRVDLAGDEYDLDLESLEDVSVQDTSHIRVFRDAAILDQCDLIDMPGISDPNMDAEVWQRVLPMADMVIWCTHATQAWRQSEAAVWSTMSADLQTKSFMLLTRMDKILSERDQGRVVKRVARETEGLFKGLFPISLTRALAAEGDAEKWAASGAEAFHEALAEQLEELRTAKFAVSHDLGRPRSDRVVTPSRIRPRPLSTRRASRGSGHDAA